MADSQVPWGVDALGGTVSEPALRVRPTASDTTCPRKPRPPSPERSSNSHVKNPSNQGFDADRATECRSDAQRLRRRLELERRRGGPAGHGQARHRPAVPVDLPRRRRRAPAAGPCLAQRTHHRRRAFLHRSDGRREGLACPRPRQSSLVTVKITVTVRVDCDPLKRVYSTNPYLWS